MNPVTRNIIIFTAIIIAVFVVRLFFIGSYRITGSRTGETLSAGDYVLVNKLKSDSNPGQNRLVLYKSPLRRDADNPPLIVGRCIGLPGDTIQLGTEGFRVNGKLLPNAPMMQPTFRISRDIKENLLVVMDSLRIPLRDIKEDSISIMLRMSIHEKELLTKNMSKIVQIEMVGDHRSEYEFLIPEKGIPVHINEISLMVCKEAILSEAGDAAVIEDGKLYIIGEIKTSFTFNRDYFWILSENETDGIDSRHLGLIPENYITGNIWFCWYSKNSAYSFKKIR